MNFLKAFSLLFLLTGCIIGPDDSRSNPNDPKSSNFRADFSQPQVKTNQSNKDLTVIWSNRSRYGSGYIVEKKLSDTYEIIDTLRNNTIYVDSSKEYSRDLKFKITSFIENDKGDLSNKYSQETEAINFGNISNATAFANDDSLSIQWYNQKKFTELTTIEMREKNSTEWSELYSNSKLDGIFQRVTFDLSVDKSYEFKISLYLINYKSQLQKFHEKVISYGY